MMTLAMILLYAWIMFEFKKAFNKANESTIKDPAKIAGAGLVATFLSLFWPITFLCMLTLVVKEKFK